MPKKKAAAKIASAIKKAEDLAAKLDSLLDSQGKKGTSTGLITTKAECQKIVDDYKVAKESAKDELDRAKKMKAVIDEMVKEKETWDQFSSKATGSFSFYYKFRVQLYKEFMAVPRNAAAPKASFKTFAGKKQIQYADVTKVDKDALDEISKLKDELPKCSDLPKEATPQDQQIGLAGKTWAAMKALNFASDKCLAGSASAMIIELIKKGVEYIVEIILDLFTGFVVTLIKVAYWFLKALFYTFKAAKLEKSAEGKAVNFGKAVGAAIRALLVLLKVPGAKKLSKNRKYS